ncbi:S24 family peptidase, partial [Klebsiella pneumoniae]|uniref:LexA family protein n=1 Tax=Klebsiella pneumoniae TaxID=573 RepID=UPI0033154F52
GWVTIVGVGCKHHWNTHSITPRAGMVVVAVVNGEFTCKQLAYEHGAPVLRAANKAYPDIRLRDGEDLEVFGVVTRCIHKLPGF